MFFYSLCRDVLWIAACLSTLKWLWTSWCNWPKSNFYWGEKELINTMKKESSTSHTTFFSQNINLFLPWNRLVHTSECIYKYTLFFTLFCSPSSPFLSFDLHVLVHSLVGWIVNPGEMACPASLFMMSFHILAVARPTAPAELEKQLPKDRLRNLLSGHDTLWWERKWCWSFSNDRRNIL